MGPAELFWPMMVVITTASLSFVAVIVWIALRTRERELHYRNETIKKIAESGTSTAAIDYVRETDRLAAQHRRGGLRLGGLISIAVAIGLMVFLRAIAGSVYLVGLIPLLVGVVLFSYAQLMMPAK